MIPHATQPFGLCAVGLIQVKAFGLAQVFDLHRQSKFYGKLKTIASHLHGFTLYGFEDEFRKHITNAGLEWNDYRLT